MCEDTCSSYIPMFGGGYRQPQTFIESVKPLIDRLNAYYSVDPAQLTPDEFTRTTDSLDIYDNVVVIEKTSRARPQPCVYGSVATFHSIGPSVSGE